MLDNIIAAMRVAAALEGKLLSDDTIARARRALKGDPAVKESSPELSDIYMVKETRGAQISYVPVTVEHITASPTNADKISGKCWSHNYVAEVVCGNVVLRCSFCKKPKGIY